MLCKAFFDSESVKKMTEKLLAFYLLKSDEFVIAKSEGAMIHIYIIFVFGLMEITFALVCLPYGFSVVEEKIHIVV